MNEDGALQEQRSGDIFLTRERGLIWHDGGLLAERVTCAKVNKRLFSQESPPT